MTAYSKVCPKCQNLCDLASTSCKRCKLKFGPPPKEEKKTGGRAAPAPEPSITPRALIMLGVVVVLLLAGVIQIVASAQERAQRQKQIESEGWDAYLTKRDSAKKF